jgi:hypothetical protein
MGFNLFLLYGSSAVCKSTLFVSEQVAAPHYGPCALKRTLDPAGRLRDPASGLHD